MNNQIKNTMFARNRKLWIGGTILLLSIVLRFWKLGSVPVGLYWDEVAMYVDAKTISQTGKDMHGNTAFRAIFQSYGDYKLPMYIWLASVSFKLFGISDLSLRLPSAVFGVLQGWVVFLIITELAKESLSKKISETVGFLGWFVIAVSPWSVLFSRTGFEGFIGQVFLSISVLSMLYARKNKRWFFSALLFGLASVYSYYSVRFVWPVVFVAFFIFIEFSPKDVKRSLTRLLFYFLCLLAWAVCILPLFLSPFYKASQVFRLSTNSLMDLAPYSIQSNVYREISGNTKISRILYHHRILQLKDLLRHYSDHFDLNYLFITGDSNLRHGTGNHGLFLYFCLPLLLAGALYLVKKRFTLFFFLFTWWSIALLPASVPTETPHALRSLNALVPIVIMMAFGFIPFHFVLQELKEVPFRKVIYVCLGVLVFAEVAWFCMDYFTIYPQKSARSWQQGYKDIVLQVDQHRDMYDKIWLNPDDDRFFLWYFAYAQVSPTEIQTAMQHEVILKSWKNLEFQQFSWGRSPTPARPFIVVDLAGKLEKTPDHDTLIYDSFGKPKFEVGIYDHE